MVEELFDDVRDGLVLYYLLAVLSQGASVRLGKAQMGTLRIQHVQNVNIVLKYLRTFVATDRQTLPDAASIVDGQRNAILSLVWWIITHHSGAGFGSDGQAMRKRTIDWAQRQLAAYFPVTSLKDEVFRDGRAFLALVSSADPMRFPYTPCDSPARNLNDAFEAAKQLYDVPILLDASDPDCAAYEQAVMTYLSEMMPRLGAAGSEVITIPADLRSVYAFDTEEIAAQLAAELSSAGLTPYAEIVRQQTAQLWLARAQGSASALLTCLERLGVGDARDRVLMTRLLLDPGSYPEPNAPPTQSIEGIGAEMHRAGLARFIGLVRSHIVELWCEREIGGAEALDATLLDLGVADMEHRASCAEILLDPTYLPHSARHMSEPRLADTSADDGIKAEQACLIARHADKLRACHAFGGAARVDIALRRLGITGLAAREKVIVSIVDEARASRAWPSPLKVQALLMWLRCHASPRCDVCEVADTRSGEALLALLERLDARRFPYKPREPAHENISHASKLLEEHFGVPAISPSDSITSDSLLVSYLISVMRATDSGKGSAMTAEAFPGFEKQALQFVQFVTDDFSGVRIRDLKRSLRDGKAFLALVHMLSPSECEFDPTEDAAATRRLAFARAREVLGIQTLLDPEDDQCYDNEAGVLHFLAHVIIRAPDDALDAAIGQPSFTCADACAIARRKYHAWRSYVAAQEATSGPGPEDELTPRAQGATPGAQGAAEAKAHEEPGIFDTFLDVVFCREGEQEISGVS